MTTLQPKYSQEQLQRRRRKTWLAIGVIAVLAAVLAIVLAVLPEGYGSKTGAEIVCEQFIDERLKTPRSASYRHTSTYREGDGWVAIGTVDSQNSFGSEVRLAYRCKVERMSGGGYRLVDLSVE